MENVVDTGGDRFADIVENVNLNGSLVHVIHYVDNIVQNDENDTDAKTCLKILESMASNCVDAIGGAIE